MRGRGPDVHTTLQRQNFIIFFANMTEVSSAGSSATESATDKVVLVGDVGVGKTSIFLRFKTGKFQETTPSHNPRDGEWRREWQVAGSNVSVGPLLSSRNI